MSGGIREAPPRNAAGLTPKQVRLAVLGIFIASFVATIDATIVATSLQTITGELGRPEQGPLIVLSYLLATTASTPFWGRFGDVRGRKFTMQILIAMFSISSLAVALAQSMNQLIGARPLQGLAGGGVITMFVLHYGVPPSRPNADRSLDPGHAAARRGDDRAIGGVSHLGRRGGRLGQRDHRCVHHCNGHLLHRVCRLGTARTGTVGAQSSPSQSQRGHHESDHVRQRDLHVPGRRIRADLRPGRQARLARLVRV